MARLRQAATHRPARTPGTTIQVRRQATSRPTRPSPEPSPSPEQHSSERSKPHPRWLWRRRPRWEAPRRPFAESADEATSRRRRHNAAESQRQEPRGAAAPGRGRQAGGGAPRQLAPAPRGRRPAATLATPRAGVVFFFGATHREPTPAAPALPRRRDASPRTETHSPAAPRPAAPATQRRRDRRPRDDGRLSSRPTAATAATATATGLAAERRRRRRRAAAVLHAAAPRLAGVSSSAEHVPTLRRPAPPTDPTPARPQRLSGRRPTALLPTGRVVDAKSRLLPAQGARTEALLRLGGAPPEKVRPEGRPQRPPRPRPPPRPRLLPGPREQQRQRPRRPPPPPPFE
mmetsp:Transcript_19943/g.64224  ORF Transcript_19943/g.64224 Transcript_19943/m.64224 type:complete len:346 (+) Transcript_19943:463-1500(+)